MTTSRFSAASAHGRFQPLHNGHLEYLLEAKRRTDFLWIGITAVEQETAEARRGTQRETPGNNPLTFFERVEIIDAALRENAMTRDEFAIVPFPIEFPEKLANYLPIDIPCLTTIYEEWNREKVHLLQQIGYQVIVLYERELKAISGRAIREDILRGGVEWRTQVPAATQLAVTRLNLRERLRTLAK